MLPVFWCLFLPEQEKSQAKRVPFVLFLLQKSGKQESRLPDTFATLFQ